MLRIALGTLRSRAGGILGALVGVTVAVSLVVSSGIVLESTLRTEIPIERLVEAAVVVDRGQSLGADGGEVDEQLPERTRLDDRLASRLRAMNGVARAIPDRTFPLQIVGRERAQAAGSGGDHHPGHGWSSATLGGLELTAGHEPRAVGDVVLDERLARGLRTGIGDGLRIAAATGSGVFTVVGVAAPTSGRVPAGAPAAYLRDDVAARLSGTEHRVELIGITVQPGADVDRVASRVREVTAPLGLRVLTGSKRAEAESLESVLNRDGILSGLALLAAIGLFVAVFVVSSAFALSVQQRHRELALLRAIGATPRQVRRLIAAEAVVIAVAGTVLATLLAIGLAEAERRMFVRAGVMPSDLRLVVGWIPPVVGLVAAIVTTQVASFVSGRRASRIHPVDALREASVQRQALSRRRSLAGLVALGVGVAVFVGTARDVSGGGGDDAPAAGLVWMLAAVLLGPALALPFVWFIGRPLRMLSPGAGLLAGASCRANLGRLTSVATPLMLSVSLACALLISRATVEQVTREQIAASIAADHVVLATGDGLMPSLADDARAAAGVRRAVAMLTTSVVVGGGDNPTIVPAQALDTPALGGILDPGVTAGALSDLRGMSIAADERLARGLGWRVGDGVNVRLGDGEPVRLRVVALFRRPLGFGQVALPRQVVATHVSDPLDDAVLVATESGNDGAPDVAGLRALVAGERGTELLTRAQYLALLDAGTKKQSLAVYALLGIVVAFSAIAAVNALAVAVSERARDLELLRLIGATRRQLRATIRFEVLIIVAFATVVGALTAAPGMIAFTYGQTGSAVPTVPAWLWLGLPLVAAFLAFAAIAAPLRSALRAGRGSVTAGAE